jgi:LAGLIDADG-like domain
MALIDQGGRFQSTRTPEDFLKLAAQDLETLDPEEREVLELLLQDFSAHGKSPIFETASNLLYRTPPVDMDTWFNDPYYCGTFAKELFPELKKDLTELFMGRYSEALFGGGIGTGKRLKLSGIAVTPYGFKKIGDLKVGDELCNPDGSICRVTHLHEIVFEDEYIFEMQDGQEIASCKEHLWYGGWRRDKSDFCASWDNARCIKTTEEIYHHTHKERSKDDQKHLRLFKIPITEPVQFHDQGGRSVDPYLLGYMLGNGQMSGKAIKITVPSSDFRVYKKLADRIGQYSITDFTKYGRNCVDILFIGSTKKVLRTQLAELGLFGKKSQFKFIPDAYRFAPIEDRQALLQGLMDSDGSADKSSGSVKFRSTSLSLALGVQELARSLGCYASLTEGPETERLSDDGSKTYLCKKVYTVYIRSRNDSKLFRLTRKKKNCRKKNGDLFNVVTNVKIGKKSAMRCITVDHPNGLYLTDNFTVTHNSTIAKYAILRMIYEVSCLRDPHEAYGVSYSDKIAFPCISVTEAQAHDLVFEKIKLCIEMSPYFQKEFRPFRISNDGGIVFPNGVWIPPGLSTERKTIGINAFGSVLEEVNFFRSVKNSNPTRNNQDYAEAIYKSIKRRMQSRFLVKGRLPGILIMISSKTSLNSFTERRLKEGLNDPNFFCRERAVYEIAPERYSGEKFRVAIGNESKQSRILSDVETPPEQMRIIEVPVEFKEAFDKDINSAIREIAGYSTTSITPFISKTEKIFECIDQTRVHPFSEYIWSHDVAGRFDWSKLARQGRDGAWQSIHYPSSPRFVSIDFSKSGDATGFAMGCIGPYVPVKRIGADDQDMLPVFHIDFVLRIEAATKGEVIQSEIRNLIYELSAHGFFIRQVSSDTFQNLATLQTLRQKGYNTKEISVDRTTGPYDLVKLALYENRISMYRYDPLLRELKDLQKNWKSGKVDHPDPSEVPGASKDVSDALAQVCVQLHDFAGKHALDSPIVQNPVISQEEDNNWILENAISVSDVPVQQAATDWRSEAEKRLAEQQPSEYNYNWRQNFKSPFEVG